MARRETFVIDGVFRMFIDSPCPRRPAFRLFGWMLAWAEETYAAGQ